MREIKFRGKTQNRNCWFYGDLRRVEKDHFLIIPLNEIPGIDKHKVDIETVGQFTGLKDKNGKEIYEGDIIEYTQHMFNTEKVRIERKEVKWKTDRWNVYETNAGESNIEIIGNIHENPDLLCN